MRVSPARLGELLSTSEEMLALAGRHSGAATQWKPLDDALVDLRDDLRRARHTMRDLKPTPVAGEDAVHRRDMAAHYREITNPAVHTAGFLLIIAAETAAAVLYWISASLSCSICAPPLRRSMPRKGRVSGA